MRYRIASFFLIGAVFFCGYAVSIHILSDVVMQRFVLIPDGLWYAAAVSFLIVVCQFLWTQGKPVLERQWKGRK